MGYPTIIAIPLLLFVAIYFPQNAVVHAASPFTHYQTLDSFFDAMLIDLSDCGVFSGGQIADMGTIADTMKQSVGSLVASGKSSAYTLQALNTAFVSSIAEIAISEPGGGSLNQKTNAIIQAVEQAMAQSTGTVDYTFVNEIRQLISMFAQASANEVGTSAAASVSASTSAYGQGAGSGSEAGAGAGAGTGAGAGAGFGGSSYQQLQ